MIRTRFAPSPTGFLHIGGLRTAVYAYALAKHSQGQFVLRIEDTDQKREVPGATDKLYSILDIFGIKWDEQYIQSQRVPTGIYRQAAESLLSSGHAFYCQCQGRNAKSDGFSKVLRDPCRDLNLKSGAVKLKVPDQEIVSFTDFVLREQVSWNSRDVPDATLLKSDGFPTYHLAMPVDDHDMQITHVIRAVEWLPSTPIHILVFKYLNYVLPQIGHPSAILDIARGKLSKRKGNVSCEQFLQSGYLPQAILNFIILLGWAPKDNRELYTLSEFVENFDIKGFQKSNPKFNLDKLNWFNAHYLKTQSDTELTRLVKPFMKNNLSDTVLTQVVGLLKDRLVKLTDFDQLSSFFASAPQIDPQLFPDRSQSRAHLQFALNKFAHLSDWNKDSLESGLVDDVKSQGWKVGDFFMSLRIAVCGSKFTPPLTESMVVLGQAETLSRLTHSLRILTD